MLKQFAMEQKTFQVMNKSWKLSTGLLNKKFVSQKSKLYPQQTSMTEITNIDLKKGPDIL
jgi:hypothetical protein